MVELLTARMEIPDEANIIIGQSHFIKTVEDIYEANRVVSDIESDACKKELEAAEGKIQILVEQRNGRMKVAELDTEGDVEESEEGE
jgi:adenosine/AMP kinase